MGENGDESDRLNSQGRRTSSSKSAKTSPESSASTSRSAFSARMQAARRRRGSHVTRDLTKGSVPRNLWYLSWPQVSEGALTVVDQVADLIWAGRLGYQAIAGLGVGQIIIMVAMTARMGLESGMRAMISRAIGARQVRYANHVLQQSLILQTGLAVVMIAFGFLLTEPILRVLGLSQTVMDQASGYMKVQFIAMSMMGYQRTMGASLQAAGDSITQLKAIGVTRVIHLALSPLLAFGIWVFPDLGLAGMAAANLVAQVVGTTIVLYVLIRGRSRLRLTFRNVKPDFPLIWRLIKIGSPASVTNVQRGLSQLAMVGIIAPFGDSALAAFAMTRRAENVVNHGSRGFGRAAGALAGQNLGAGQKPQAVRSVQWALVYSGVGSAAIAICFILFPGAVTSFFSNDAEFVSTAATWLRILAIGYITMSCVQVFTQAFNTTGNTVAPMVITFGTMWALEVPLALGLSRIDTLGQFGLPWATVAASATRFVMFAYYMKLGRWLKTGMI